MNTNIPLSVWIIISLRGMLYISITFFTLFLQQILSGRLLLIVIDEKKSNLSYRFKLELITTYYLKSVILLLLLLL